MVDVDAGAVELRFCNCMWCSGGERALDADAADDHVVPVSRRIAVGSRIKPQQHLCHVALCPAYVKGSFGWLSRLIQFMETVMKKSGWSLERLSVAENILWCLLLGSRAHLVLTLTCICV